MRMLTLVILGKSPKNFLLEVKAGHLRMLTLIILGKSPKNFHLEVKAGHLRMLTLSNLGRSGAGLQENQAYACLVVVCICKSRKAIW